MKTFTLFSIFAATALAVPTVPGPSQCPANAAQPKGKLPKGSVSTSALVPISARLPDKAFDDSDWAFVTPNDFCTVFNLDLDPAATQGKLCNLVFNFPSILQARDFYWFSGSGKFTFTGYAFGVGAEPGVTTYNNQPAPGPSPPNPPPVMKPGNSYVIHSAPCGVPADIPGPVTVSGSLCSKDTTFFYKQKRSECSLGFFVVLTKDPNA